MNKLIIGAGACIMQAIMRQFGTIPGIADRADLHLSQTVAGGRPKVAPDLLARCSVLIEEAAPWQGSGTLTAEERALLPAGCATITVPTLHFNSLWPLMTEDPRNKPEPGAPYGRIPFGMGDRIGLKLVQSEPDPARRRAAYDATALRSVVNLARSHELEIRNCFAREQGCDVRVAAYVMANFREKRLFYTHAHPTGELMYFVLAQLYALPALRDILKLPYDQLITGARVWADTSNVFGGEEAPIHPEVATHFGLGWWQQDMRYSWLDQARTFDQWIDWYLTYTPVVAAPPPPPPPPPAPVQAATPGESLQRGFFLDTLHEQGRVPGTLVLEPMAQIARVDPFAAIGLDPKLAPHAAMFTDPAARRYRASRTLLSPLKHAAILGTSGLVLHEGTILGDSFRSLSPGPDNPVVAAVSGEMLTLQSGVVPVRKLPGRAFCGFAPGWADQAHWIIGGLPRLIAYGRLRARDPALRLVLPAFAAGTIQAQSLALLGIGPEQVIEIGPTESLEFEEVTALSALDLWSISPFSRHAAHEVATAIAMAGDAEVKAAERIYVRSSSVVAPMGNVAALTDALAGLGFTVVDFDALDLRQRVAVMRRARFVVGEHGPSLANLFFCSPGTQVLELFGPGSAQPMYWSVASCSGLGYGYVVGEPAGAAEGRNTPYTMPPDRIAAALSAMLTQG